MSEAREMNCSLFPGDSSEFNEIAKTLFEDSRDGLLIVNPDLKIVAVNPKWIELTGHSLEEIPDISLADLIWRDENATHEPLSLTALLAASELHMIRKDGKLITINITTYMLPGGNILLIGRDIIALNRIQAVADQRICEMDALNRLGFTINTPLSPHQTSSVALQGVMDSVHPDLAFLFRRAGDQLILSEILPTEARQRFGTIPDHKLGECICGLAVLKGSSLYSRDIFSDSRCTWEECKKANIKSFAAIPVGGKEQISGVIGLASYSERDFESQAEFLETLARLVSVAISNAWLYEIAQEEVAERTRAQEALKTLATSYAHLSGKQFYEAVTNHIATALGVDFVFVGQFNPKQNNVRVLGGYARGEPMDEMIYDLKDTPCDHVIGNQIIVYPDGVQSHFPKDLLLEEMEIEGYLGAPILDKQLLPIGIMVALHTKPLSNWHAVTDLFKIFLDRVAAEMQRSQTQVALEKSEARTRLFFERQIVGMAIVSPEKKWLQVNDCLCLMLGYSRDELLQLTWAELTHAGDLGSDLMQFNRMIAGEIDDYTREKRFIRKDGSVMRTDLAVACVRRADGAVDYVLAVLKDITDRKRMEEELRKSEFKYRELVENANSIILRWNPRGEITFLNEFGQKFFGYREDEILGRNVIGTITPDIESTGRDLQPLMKQICNNPSAFESNVNENVLKDGTRVWLAWTNKTVFDAEGNLIEVLSIGTDITELKETEDALRESEERFRLAMEASRDGLWDWNVLTGEVYYSPSYSAMLGYSSGDVPGHVRSWTDLIHPEDRDTAMKANIDCIENRREVFDIEFRMQAKHGEWCWILGRGKAVARDSSGRAIRMVGTHTDITDRKRAEEVLIKRALLLRRAEEVAKFGNWEFILDEQRVQASEGVKAIYGLGPEDIKITDIRSIALPEYRHMLAGALADLVEHGKHYNVQFKICRPTDGKIIDVHSIAEYDADRNIVFGVIQDITDRVQYDNERESLQAQLIQAQKMESVGRLAGGVAHDFNNMLSVILGYAELGLMKCSQSDPIHANLEMINEAAERSANIVRQLLAFARKQTVSPKVLDLNEAVSGMLKMIQRLIGEDIDIAWMPHTDLWPVAIDPSQIDQLLANVCVNARDAIYGVGKVTIETENAVFDEAYCAVHADFVLGEYVMLAVSDSGCGMDKDILDHIFEPFYTTKELGKGTGLGLATVYGIVKQNDGFINVYSEPGNGTTFKIYLPRHVGEAVESMAASTEEVPKGLGETLLLVEDEEMILNASKELLEDLGYRVLTAGTPGEAIRQAKAHTEEIQLLITDVVMPEMNGRDLEKLLREIKPGLKCLFSSGYTTNVIAHRGVLEKGVHFLQKPYSVKDLAIKVRTVLKHE